MIQLYNYSALYISDIQHKKGKFRIMLGRDSVEVKVCILLKEIKCI